jgi:hypothetical protein
MSAIEHLKALAWKRSREKHPSLPEHARVIHKYKDNTANGLTKCVIDWITFNGYRADRISSAGRYIEGEKIKGVNGNVQLKGSFVPGPTRKGYADINATIKGRSVMIEIKMKDKMSEAQIKFKEAEERAGGIYIVVHSFEEFLTEYKKIMTL